MTMPAPNPTPHVSCARGAPMGRFTGNPDPDADCRFYLKRVPIDSGGYDRGGAYWGLGAPLYWFCAEDGTAEGFFRLDRETRSGVAQAFREAGNPFPGSAKLDRETAKAQVREQCPDARFFQ